MLLKANACNFRLLFCIFIDVSLVLEDNVIQDRTLALISRTLKSAHSCWMLPLALECLLLAASLDDPCYWSGSLLDDSIQTRFFPSDKMTNKRYYRWLQQQHRRFKSIMLLIATRKNTHTPFQIFPLPSLSLFFISLLSPVFLSLRNPRHYLNAFPCQTLATSPRETKGKKKEKKREKVFSDTPLIFNVKPSCRLYLYPKTVARHSSRNSLNKQGPNDPDPV